MSEDKKAKRPAFQFYPADWRKDVELRACSVAARGLWIDMLCIAHECDPYGNLTVNSKPMTTAQIAGQVGLSAVQCQRLVDELLANGVARQSDAGVIYSKRMVDDERVRMARAEGGKAGAEHGHKGASHGSKGGRPNQERGEEKPPLQAPLEPPPSSSSSSSTSVDTPIAPKGGDSKPAKGKPLVTLRSWLADVKAKGEQAIPADDAVFAYGQRVGLPMELLQLAWREFRRVYTVDRKDKRYRDWRIVFNRAVQGNWLKLWHLDAASGQYGLTTVGLQVQRNLAGGGDAP